MIHDHVGGDGEAKTIYQRPIKIKILLKEEGSIFLYLNHFIKILFCKIFLLFNVFNFFTSKSIIAI